MTTLSPDKLTVVTITADSVNEMILDGQKTVQLVVRTDQFLNLEVPNNANSRSFTGNKNKAVPAMIQQLRSEPEYFRFMNSGIRMVATDIVRNGNEVSFYFNQDEGIFNGGHTYEVLKTFGNKNAYVYVTVEVSLPEDQLIGTSIALNSSKKLENISEGEKSGAHQWIKKVLPTESIIYREGDSGDYKVTEVLKVANLYKINKSRMYMDSSYQKSVLSIHRIVAENNTEQVLQYTQYILPDLWNLYKELIGNETIIRNLPEKFSKGNLLVSGIPLAFLCGIQYMTEINRNNIPMWKKGYNRETALKLCEKLSKEIGNVLSKAPFKDNIVEFIYRENKFLDKVKRTFLDELMMNQIFVIC